MTAPTHPHPRAWVFDLDGTLVDTVADFTAAVNVMLTGLGRSNLSEQDVRGMVGKGGPYLLQCALLYPRPATDENIADLDPALFQAAWASYMQAYGAINGQGAQVYDGVRPALEALRKQGQPMACLTNKPLAHARALLQQKELAQFFKPVYGGDSFSSKKPDPAGLLQICQELGLPATEVVMVGDSINDALAAQRAGCMAALVSYGYNHGVAVQSVQANWHVDSLADLLEMV